MPKLPFQFLEWILHEAELEDLEDLQLLLNQEIIAWKNIKKK